MTAMPPYAVWHAATPTSETWKYAATHNERTALLTHHVNSDPYVALYGPDDFHAHHTRSLDTAHHLAELWVMQR